MKSLSRVQLVATPWTVACQAPLSMEFSRQEYWSGLPFSSPGDLPDQGIKPGSLVLWADSLPSEPPGKPKSYQERARKDPVSKKRDCGPGDNTEFRESVMGGTTLISQEKMLVIRASVPPSSFSHAEVSSILLSGTKMQETWPTCICLQ